MTNGETRARCPHCGLLIETKEGRFTLHDPPKAGRLSACRGSGERERYGEATNKWAKL